jgi:hypothetical protein
VRAVSKLTLVAVALAAALAFAGCSDSTHGETITLKLIEPEEEENSTFGFIGQPNRKGFKPGNGFAFQAPLLNPSSKEEVGELVATCIATEPSSGDTLHGQCNGTAIVPGGTLSLNVGGDAGENVHGSITGGTGKYAGATGTFSSVGQNEQKDTYEITLP